MKIKIIFEQLLKKNFKLKEPKKKESKKKIENKFNFFLFLPHYLKKFILY